MTHVKYKLKKPIVIEGQPAIEEFSLRSEVVAGDMRGVPLRDPMLHDDLMKIIGRLAVQPDHVINKLSLEDLLALEGTVGGFFEGGQATGTEPSPS